MLSEGKSEFFPWFWLLLLLLRFRPKGGLAGAWLDGGGSAGVVEPRGTKENVDLLVGVAALARVDDVGF